MTTTDEHLLSDIAAAVLRRAQPPGWQLRRDTAWTHIGPAVPTERIQGWKLHVSATPLSAPLVLAAAAEVLIAASCPFKFAPNLAAVEEQTSVRADRSQAGKFVTAYPGSDVQLLDLAHKLDQRTLDLPGPRILSDRPYRPGSLVQLRFGAFRGVPTLTDDGGYEARLRNPDGAVVADERLPWFAPPRWASLPPGLPELPDAASGARSPGDLPVLAGRYEIHAAIRHSARGGVFRGRDLRNGTDVVLKQARPHIGGRRDGRDARDQLAHEAAVLAELTPLTPALIDLVTVDGDDFLVEEFVPGRSLADHIAEHIEPDPRGTIADAEQIAAKLIELVRQVHQHGWVLRDLSTTNIIVRPDGRVVLIDPEYAARPGDVVQRAVTPGFAPPEVVDGPVHARAPGFPADAYAVGAVLTQLAMGVPPMLPRDDDDTRTVTSRIARQLATARERPLVRRWHPMLLGLLHDEPARRWTLEHAAVHLARPPVSVTVDSGHDATTADRVLDDGLAYLAESRQPASRWLWPADAFGANTDPLNVQYGAGGVLAVLVRAARAGRVDLHVVADVASWIAARVFDAPRLLPGLHFGRSGTALALAEAADLLDDSHLRAIALTLVGRISLATGNPDVCHGVAGAGLARLALPDEARWDDDIARCADRLLASARYRDDGVFWPIPDDADSRLAGAWHYGFGHGVAGVGTFLLAAAARTGDPRHRELAFAAADTLVDAADHDPRTGAVTWRSDRNRPAPEREMRLHWCSGASGIASFLVRVERDTPAPHRTAVIRAAAHAVHVSRWSSGTATCHGLAGDAQLLLDAADLATDSGDPIGAAHYRQQADDLVDVLLSRTVRRDGRLLLPDESGLRVVAGYGTGLAGALDLLLRLRHRGGRLWYPDAASARVTVPEGRR